MVSCEFSFKTMSLVLNLEPLISRTSHIFSAESGLNNGKKTPDITPLHPYQTDRHQQGYKFLGFVGTFVIDNQLSTTPHLECLVDLYCSNHSTWYKWSLMQAFPLVVVHKSFAKIPLSFS